MLTVTEQPTTILVYTRNNEEDAQLKVFIMHTVFVIIAISNYSGKPTRNLPHGFIYLEYILLFL